MSEVWRPIPGWDDYEASTLGQVRVLTNKRGGRLPVPLVMKPGLANGRPSISLQRGPRRESAQVGVWVLRAFVGPRPDGLECSHRNGNPFDNRIENLTWETHAVNMARKWDHGTVLSGSRNGAAKLIERDVEIVKRMLSLKIPQVVIAEVFDVDQSTISAINSGRNWRVVPAVTE